MHQYDPDAVRCSKCMLNVKQILCFCLIDFNEINKCICVLLNKDVIMHMLKDLLESVHYHLGQESYITNVWAVLSHILSCMEKLATHSPCNEFSLGSDFIQPASTCVLAHQQMGGISSNSSSTDGTWQLPLRAPKMKQHNILQAYRLCGLGAVCGVSLCVSKADRIFLSSWPHCSQAQCSPMEGGYGNMRHSSYA